MKSIILTAASVALLSYAGLAKAESIALSESELKTATELLNTVAQWKDLSLPGVHVVWAGELGDLGTKIQLEACNEGSCGIWKDLFIKRDDSSVIADGPTRFLTSIESPTPNPFYPRRPEFIRTLNAMFQVPEALERTLPIGNSVAAAIHAPISGNNLMIGGDVFKYTFVVARVGAWINNVESGGLVILQSSTPTYRYRIFGQ